MRAVEVGFDVNGLELDERKVKALSAGESFVEDISDQRLQDALDSGPPPRSTTSTASTSPSSRCPLH